MPGFFFFIDFNFTIFQYYHFNSNRLAFSESDDSRNTPLRSIPDRIDSSVRHSDNDCFTGCA